MRPLRAVCERLAQVRELLLRPSPGNLELCGRALDDAHGLLKRTALAPPVPRAETLALHAELERLTALARHAAAFYLECVRTGNAGKQYYGPGAHPGARHQRLLAEG